MEQTIQKGNPDPSKKGAPEVQAKAPAESAPKSFAVVEEGSKDLKVQGASYFSE